MGKYVPHIAHPIGQPCLIDKRRAHDTEPEESFGGWVGVVVCSEENEITPNERCEVETGIYSTYSTDLPSFSGNAPQEMLN